MARCYPDELPPEAPIPDSGLSIKEVATRPRIPVQTLRTWRKQGHKRGPRGQVVDGRLRYPASEVEAWIARVQGTADEADNDIAS
jgi:Helix-turn-helix domain